MNIYIQFAGSFRNLGARPTFRDGLKGHENKNGEKKNPTHLLMEITVETYKIIE